MNDNSDECFSKTPNFWYDEACLDIHLDDVQNFSLNAQYSDCVNCAFEEWNSTKMKYVVQTIYQIMFRATFDGDACNRTFKFEEHGRYGWDIGKNNCTDIYVKEEPDNAYLPLVGAVIVFICFAIIWYLVKRIYKWTMKRETIRKYFKPTDISHDLENPEDNTTPVVEQHPSRIKSIDTFRGICIILMIFINNGGGNYWFFQHTFDWNGITVASLPFPWFMWLMGFSITISLRSRLQRAVPRRQIILHIIYRSFALVLIGIIINSYYIRAMLNKIHFLGVLQRLGTTYCFVGILETIFTKRTHIENNFGRFECIADILVAWPQWLVIISLVIIHTCITFFLPVPGCPTGYLGPGGMQFYPDYENCTGGAAVYIDTFILGSSESILKPNIYKRNMLIEAEGLLGNLTSIFTVYMGTQAARILYTYKTLSGKTIRWISWSIITGLIAGILCNFSKNDGVIPVNKKLWSLSFALALSSMSFFIECVLHILVDVTGKWGGRPFFYTGMNSILFYICQNFMKHTLPFNWDVSNYHSHTEYLAMNLWGCCVWIGISIFLYKRNIFFKL